jgi:hypothetical protein
MIKIQIRKTAVEVSAVLRTHVERRGPRPGQVRRSNR